ncbi:MAG: ATP-grasp domain-containing protein [Planctomycetales bacterium]|nr:ATP-grasp domain-containing protein [Planctomycetales bacterium]
MQVFVYEFVSGGGLWSKPDWGQPSGSLLAEGLAMFNAVAEDFAALKDVDVVTTRDCRIVDHLAIDGLRSYSVDSPETDVETFRRLAGDSDATLVIAPEIDGVLIARCDQVIKAGGRLLATDVDFVRLASDKYSTAKALTRAHIPTIPTLLGNDPSIEELEPPLIVKLRFGAGSLGVRRVESAIELTAAERGDNFCVQQFQAGRPASVTALRGKNSHAVFPPFWQRFRDPGFEYIGGSLIGEADLIARAEWLAEAVVDRLPKAIGYFGIDILLGSTPNDDRIVEINPRLTTSYVGLRACVRGNLAEAMLWCQTGEPFNLPRKPPTTLSFSAMGEVTVGQIG